MLSERLRDTRQRGEEACGSQSSSNNALTGPWPEGWTLLLQLLGKQGRIQPWHPNLLLHAAQRGHRGSAGWTSFSGSHIGLSVPAGAEPLALQGAKIVTAPRASRVRRAAGFGPTMLSEITPTASWCGSRSLYFSQLFAIGLQRMI